MKQPKDLKQAKELKHPKQGRDTSYLSLHQVPTKDLHFSTMRHLNNPTFPFSSISTLRYLHIPTFGRQVIRGKHVHSSVIKAKRVGSVISATGYLNSSTSRSAGTSREVDHWIKNRWKIVSLSHAFATKYYLCWSNSCSSKRLVPKLFFPVPGTIALVRNMDIGQGSGSRYTFEKHSFNQQRVSLNFAKTLCGAFSKNHN